MSPQLVDAIEAARALVRFSHCNTSSTRIYAERMEVAETFMAAARALATRSTDEVLADVSEGPQVTALVAHIGRLSRCQFSNRRGFAYARRRAAVAQMRGCLIQFDEVCHGSA